MTMSNETLNRVPSGVPTGGQFAAATRSEAGVNLTSPGDPHAHFAAAGQEVGLPVMGEVYSILHDRETIPSDYLADRASAGKFESDYEKFIGPAIDELEHKYVNVGDIEVGPGAAEWEHVDRTCREAGLESMSEFYDILANRGILTADAAKALTADDVAADYQAYVAPAIDKFQHAVGTAYTYDLAEGNEDLERALDGMRSYAEDYGHFGEGFDTSAYDDATEAAYDEFDAAGGGAQALLVHADRIENEIASSLLVVRDTGGYNTDGTPATYDDGWDARVEDTRVELKRIADGFRVCAENIAAAAP